jgi:two-component system chemotaxis sensor kinase CheA
MAGRLDDLVSRYLHGLADRVVEASNLWLAFEDGTTRDLSALKRLLHTIKGEGHMLGLEKCGALCAGIEDLVVAVERSGASPREAGDSLLAGFDALSLLATEPERGESGLSIEPVLEALREAVGVLPQQNEASRDQKRRSVATPRASQSPHGQEQAHEPRLENSMRVADVQPNLHDLRRLFEEQERLKPRLREVQRILRAIVAELDPSLPPAVLGEQAIKTLGATADLDRRLSTIRSEWSANSFAMGLTLDQLTDVTRRASVVSIDRLRSTLERTARATARALHKEIALHVEGDAYIDAAIAERLEPCLLHAARNAVDHGIEASAELRVARHKPVQGQLLVRIEQHVSAVRVTVQDDGGGVDIEQVRARFSLADDASDQQVLRKLFESGVSTRNVTTDISGRGVGLDVIAREVEGAGGSIDIESTLGLGFRLTLTMPTVMRADLVVPFVHQGKRLAVPSRNVENFGRVTKIIQTATGVHTPASENGEAQLIPLYSLRSVFGDAAAPEVGARTLVIRHDSTRFALVVDEYASPRPLPFQPAAELAFRSTLVRAVAPSPQGVHLLLDLDVLLAMLRTTNADAAPARTSAAKVVVVEDAPVARELLCGVLRSFRLSVTEAAHGREGLLRIREIEPDLVLTDIEMPFIGGLEMVSQLRAEPRFATLPVIVLSTDTSEVTRQRARALGVIAFLSKQKFVESELRELVDRCLQQRTK